ncbi:MAG: hypothetical protein ACPG5T_06610, partial [Endozoicomonas sp.]
TGGNDTDDTTVSKTKTGDINPSDQEVAPGDNDNSDGKTGDDQGDGKGGDSGGDNGPFLNAALNRQGSGDGGQDNSNIRRRVVERQRNTIDFGTPDFSKVESKIDNRIKKTTPRNRVNLEERVRKDLDKAIQQGKKKITSLQNNTSDTTEVRGKTPRKTTADNTASNINTRGGRTKARGPVNLEERVRQDLDKAARKGKEKLAQLENSSSGSTDNERKTRQTPDNRGKTTPKINTRSPRNQYRGPVNLEERVRQDLDKAARKGKEKLAQLENSSSGSAGNERKTRQSTAPDNQGKTTPKINTRGTRTQSRDPVNLEQRVRQDLDKAARKGKAKTTQPENNNSSVASSKGNSRQETTPDNNANSTSKINTRGTKSRAREPVNLEERVRQDLDKAAEKGRLKKR